MALLESPGDYAFVIRGVPRSIVMRCPDGCGDTITINLDRRSGSAWRSFARKSGLTIYPSVWRETGCRAHFIIWNDTLLWIGGGERAPWSDDALIATVRNALPSAESEFRSFEDIAEELDAIPWEVLWACQYLERSGTAISSDRGRKFKTPPRKSRPVSEPDRTV